MAKELLGKGAARAAGETINRRDNEVDRIVTDSVRGAARAASEENARGPVATRTRTPERKGKKGERSFGAPIK